MPVEAEPARHGVELGFQCFIRMIRSVRLEMDRSHQQAGSPPVSLQVHSSYELVAEEERQHIIAVLPLFRRNIDLDPVAETEQPFRPIPSPDERIERRKKSLASIFRGRRASRCSQAWRQPGTSTGIRTPSSASSLIAVAAASGDWRK